MRQSERAEELCKVRSGEVRCYAAEGQEIQRYIQEISADGLQTKPQVRAGGVAYSTGKHERNVRDVSKSRSTSKPLPYRRKRKEFSFRPGVCPSFPSQYVGIISPSCSLWFPFQAGHEGMQRNTVCNGCHFSSSAFAQCTRTSSSHHPYEWSETAPLQMIALSKSLEKRGPFSANYSRCIGPAHKTEIGHSSFFGKVTILLAVATTPVSFSLDVDHASVPYPPQSTWSGLLSTRRGTSDRMRHG